MRLPFQPRVTAALIIDFDNVIGQTDRLFASHAEIWVKWIERGDWDAPHGRRKLAIRRAYMNPTNRVHAAPLSRPDIKVIETPSFVNHKKSSADMEIALDAQSLLDHKPYIDEFILLSGDSDFIPLIRRLKAAGRRVVILDGPGMAAIYQKEADLFIQANAIIEAIKAGEGEFKPERRRALALWQRVLRRVAPPQLEALGAIPPHDLAALAALIVDDLSLRREWMLDRQRFRELLAGNVSDFKFNNAPPDELWLGYQRCDDLMRAVAEHDNRLYARRTTKNGRLGLRFSGPPEWDATFDYDAAAARLERAARRTPGVRLGQRLVIAALSGAPGFDVGGAHAWMKCESYEAFLEEMSRRRPVLRLETVSSQLCVYVKGGRSKARGAATTPA